MLQHHSGHKWVVGTLSGLLACLFMGSSALSQEKGKEAAKDAPKMEEIRDAQKMRSLVRAGYTRPGAPPDRLNKNGKIVPLALDPEYNGSMIGSTVYFAVFRLALDQNDAVAGELGHFADLFVEGRNFENTISPQFDRKAKYLYVYQIVNDRGLDPVKDGVVPAAKGDINSADVASFLLRLNVDPRYITSWGHFKNVGFAGNVTERKQSGDIVEAADGKAVVLPMAFSSNPSVLSMLPHARYMSRSPAYALGKLLPSFELASSTLNLKKNFTYNALSKKVADKVALANWEEGEYRSAEDAREPDFVQLVHGGVREGEFGNDFDMNLEAVDVGDSVFRVDFKKTNLVKLGMHSVAFGFTTDLPPTDEPIRIEPFPAKGDIKAAAAGQGTGIALAVGTAPSPVPQRGGDFAAAMGPVGSIGGGAAGGGFGGFPGIAGALGVARAPSFGGGGGSGSGSGQGSTTGNAQQAQDQSQSGKINFNATLINQQAQLQAQAQLQLQAQAQAQKQSQRQNNKNHHQVVPAPAAFILGLLGLPALIFVRRRSK
ncbi:MAG: hypothetical protein HY040_05050 [Planctomycetes bacterium]|nr:hypothetical protein [Planctomycetota bacterium]